MADESKVDEPKESPKEAPKREAKRKREASPIAVGDLVTHAGDHPLKGDGAEPVGRVVAEVPAVRILYNADGKALVDKDGATVTEDDGTRLVVSWPSLRLESKHRAEDLERREAKGGG